MTVFNVQVSQNPYLARSAGEVHAVVSISSSRPSEASAGSGAGGKLAEALIVDTSGSMEGEKLGCAIAALETAIHLLHEDAMFCVIAGSDRGKVVVPLSPATAANKATAYREVRKLTYGGGTAMSTWLAAAAREFQKAPSAIRHALLLTDGKNESEPELALATVVRECEGKFQCDARGVGTNWVPDQLRMISGRLLGTVDIIPAAQEIEQDFRAVMEAALSKSVADVSLRIWTPIGATVEFCRLVYPQAADLTNRARPVASNAQAHDFPTGAWGEEKRDYHLCIRVKPGNVGQRMCAGRVSLILTRGTAEEKVSDAMVLAQWTDDETQSAMINSAVAHYTGQAELADTIQQGLKARALGDERAATALLGRAVQIAADSNPETMKLLRKVVDIENEKEGTVKLRKGVRKEDEFALDTRSTKTARIVKGAAARLERRRENAVYECPQHHQSQSPDFCSVCGIEIVPVGPPISGAGPAIAPAPSAVGALVPGEVRAPVPSEVEAPLASALAACEANQPCPDCGAARETDAQVFCAACGFNFRTRHSRLGPCPECSTLRVSATQVFCEVCGFNFRTRQPGIPPASPGPVSQEPIPNSPIAHSTGSTSSRQAASGQVAAGDSSRGEALPTPVVIASGAASITRWNVVVQVDPMLYGTVNSAAPTGRPEQTFSLFEAESILGRATPGVRVHIPIADDSGVSRRHAVLLLGPDQGLSIRDLGSANGAQLNGTELVAGVATPLKDGDFLAIGAWTRITIRGVHT